MLYFRFSDFIPLIAESLCLLPASPYISHPPSTWQSFFYSVSMSFNLNIFFKIPHIINHTMQYLSFSAWLLSLNIMPSSFIHVVVNGRSENFLLLRGWIIFHCACVCMTSSLSIHPSMDSWVVLLPWLLWIMLLWTWVQKSVWYPVFISFRYIPKSGLLDHMVVVFKFFEGSPCYFPSWL